MAAAAKGAIERSDALVLFGATGDLAHKKIFPAIYQMERDGRLEVPVVGVASSEGDDDMLRALVQASITELVEDPDTEVVDRLLARVGYVSGDYREPDVFDALRESPDPSTAWRSRPVSSTTS